MAQATTAAVFPAAFSEMLSAMNRQVRNRAAQGTAQPQGTPVTAEISTDGLIAQADAAAGFLKTLGHEGRLTILCHLCTGEKSVTELEILLSSRQSVVSQQLARLRFEGLVQARRDGQTIYYSILDPKVIEAVALLAAIYHDPAQDRTHG